MALRTWLDCIVIGHLSNRMKVTKEKLGLLDFRLSCRSSSLLLIDVMGWGWTGSRSSTWSGVRAPPGWWV